MGFFFRKSINLGLFRINLSKKGVGVSTGVKGARVSVGPSGNNVSLGRKGFYYKSAIGKSTSKTGQNKNRANSISQQSTNSHMKYINIFGIIPSIIILAFVTFKCYEVVRTNEKYENFAVIKNSSVNIRRLPSTDSEIILKSNTGDKFSFIEKMENNWCKILVNVDTAFVNADFAEVKKELVSSMVIRRYDENPNYRYGVLTLSFIPLLFWNIFLFKIDKRNKQRKNLNSQNMEVDNLIVKAESLRKSGEFQDSIRLFKNALSINPNSSESYFGIGYCYYNMSNEEEAIINYKKGLSIESDNKPAIFNLALAYYFTNQESFALAYFKKYLELDDSDSQSNYYAGMIEKDDNLVAIYLEKSLLKGDLETKQKLSAKQFLQGKYILLGMTQLTKNQNEKARLLLQQALKIDVETKNLDIYKAVAGLLKDKGIIDLANDFYKMAGEPIVENLNSNIGVEVKPNKIGNKFTQEYYNLLQDFSKQIVDVSKKLTKDEALVEKIKDSLTESTTDTFIPYCVFYDCCQILKIISNNEIDGKSLETFGLILLSTKLLPDFADLMSHEYETAAESFASNRFDVMANYIIEIGKNKNPLDISVEGTKDNQIISSQKFQNNLSFPTALKIIDHPLFEEYSTVLYRFATILAKADNIVTKEEEEILKAIFQMTHNPIPDEKNNSLTISEVKGNETLNEVLAELDALVGLDGVKQEVKSLINYIKIQKEREKVGLKSSQVSYHCVFTGSPGTGKTTIARIVAKIYLHLGVLKKGHLVETDRSGLVAEYTGQTAVKVNKTVNSAIDGVLFIDEAYSLVGENQDDFGKEAVATLIKRMEDDRDKLIVIVAGYTNEMKNFIDTNPGFKSRFNRYIEFEDYNPKDMNSMFKLQCEKLDYILDKDAEVKLSETLNLAYNNRDKSFGNGRFVRNVFEKTTEMQANRIAGLSGLTKEILTTITVADIPSQL